MAHIGEPKRTRKAAVALLGRESNWLSRNGMRGTITKLSNGMWTVSVERIPKMAKVSLKKDFLSIMSDPNAPYAQRRAAYAAQCGYPAALQRSGRTPYLHRSRTCRANGHGTA